MLANGGLQKLQHIVALEELATGRTVLATVLRVPAAVVQLGVLLLRIRLFEQWRKNKTTDELVLNVNTSLSNCMRMPLTTGVCYRLRR